MNKVAKATIYLMIATIISKILGFGREIVLAYAYGAGMYSDAYIAAMNIPIVIFSIIGTTLGTILIPMYFEVSNELGEHSALNFINNVFNIVIIICVSMGVLGFVFAEQLVKIFATGFPKQTLLLAVDFTRVTMIGVVFTGLSYIMTGYLQIKNNFTIPGLVTIPRNIIIIIFIIFSSKYNPYIMIWGTVVGLLAEFLFQLPFAKKAGYKYKPYINIKDKYIKKAVLLIGPVLIGVAVNQVNAMVDRNLASGLAEGSMAALNYANKLNGFVIGLFIASIAVVIYPILSQLSVEDDNKKFINSVAQSINSVILLVIPISVGAIVLSTPIVKLLFQRGEFDYRATSMTATALGMYSIGMVAFGLRDILNRVFYSLQDTKTPMINGIISMVLNIILNVVLVKYLGLSGLALATSISAIFCIFLLFRSLKNKIEYFGQERIKITTFKSLIAALVMGIITYLSYNTINEILVSGFIRDVISLFGSICIGGIVYIMLLFILKVEEISLVKDVIYNK